MIFQSSDPEPIYPVVDIYHYLESNPFNVQPGKTVFIDPITEKALTFGQFQLETKQFAAGLQDSYGFQSRDVLAIFSYNQYDFGVPILGTLCAGGVVTTVNHSYTLEEVVHQLKDSGASYMVTTVDLLPTATEAAKICGIKREHIFLFGGKDEAGHKAYQSIFAKRLATPVKIDMDEIAYLCYSSGTTGKSKGVMLTHRNITSNLVQIMSYDAEVIKQKDLVILGFLPLYHIYGLMNCLHISLIT
ncbi:hypothetical protein BGZ97_013382, partial [Linnemannia gamsii]